MAVVEDGGVGSAGADWRVGGAAAGAVHVHVEAEDGLELVLCSHEV